MSYEILKAVLHFNHYIKLKTELFINLWKVEI